MKTVFVILLAILALFILLKIFAPSRPLTLGATCAPGYMPTGSGCVPTDEEIGLGPHP